MTMMRRAVLSAPKRPSGMSGTRTKGTEPRKLTAEERGALAAVATMPDRDIDTSDIPEVTAWSGAVRGDL